MSGAYVIGETNKIGPGDQDEHCVRLVLAVYTAVMASARSDRDAFNAAVQTYRGEKPDVREEAARTAVARIICEKPL